MSDRKWIHRNPPSPLAHCFDDTMVSEFEIALSIELQMAFKEQNISCEWKIEFGFEGILNYWNEDSVYSNEAIDWLIDWLIDN